jgi:tetratricopeptide (TPR) repeat protein
VSDQSAAVAPAEAPPSREARRVRCGAVPPLAHCFVGRPESGPALLDALLPGAAVALAPARDGAERPGWQASCGKTQLAVFTAESLWRSKAVDLLVWVTACSRAAILAGYGEALAAVLGAVPAGDGESVAARFTSWLAQAGRPWLVVLDDLRNMADMEGLWPHGAMGKVIVTTRERAGLPAGRVRELTVGVFSRREALGYLMDCFTLDPDQRLGAIDLIHDLGCEPLALAQASAVISSSDGTCRDYRGHVADMHGQLAVAAGGAPGPAAVTWRLCVERAQQLMPGEPVWPLLALAAVFDGHVIPGPVFTSQAACEWLTADQLRGTVDADRASHLILGLERVGLLSVDAASGPPLVRMNQAVAVAVRSVLARRVLAQTARVAADALAEVWPSAEAGPWACGHLRSCAASLHQVAGDLLWEGGVHPVLWRAGASLHHARLTGPALSWWQQMTTACERLLGAAHADTLAAGQWLAEAYFAAGQAMPAIGWFERIQAARAQALGPDHPEVIAAHVSVGRALVTAGQAAEAVSVLEQAAARFDRVCGSDHLASLAAREELAAACQAAGQPAQAIRWYRHTLAVRQRIQGTQHADTFATRHKLADACQAAGKVKDAITHAKKALAGRERVLLPDHPDIIASRASLAAACHAAGRMASAVQHYERACADSERILGADHPGTLARRTGLADAYYAVGRITDATSVLRDTAARYERIFGPDDPAVLSVRASLATMTRAENPAARPH